VSEIVITQIRNGMNAIVSTIFPPGAVSGG
jgi:hypothetical protein